MSLPLDKPDWNPTAYPSFWINHASRLLMRRFEERLRPSGFGMAYLPVAMALEEADGPLLQKDLAARARVEQPTMASLLTRMERDGLITRQPHPTDRRKAWVTLTPGARAALPELRAALAEVAGQVTRGFDDTERATFLALLQRAVTNLDPELTWPAQTR